MKHLLIMISLVSAISAFAQEKLAVVTTLSTFADITSSIGGDALEVKYIAPPRFNPHFIEPKPGDILKLKRADLFIHSGLDLEAWRDPLVTAAGRADLKVGGAKQLDLSSGIALLEVPSSQPSRSEGDIHVFGNPHYWTDPRNGLIIAREIKDKLIEIVPASAMVFNSNFAKFEEKLTAKIRDWQSMAQKKGTVALIAYHNQWPYLMNFLGYTTPKFLEPKPGIPPSPKQIEDLITYAKTTKIPAILQPSYFGKESSSELAEKIGAKLVILCESVGELPECSDYVSMIDHNVKSIVAALN